MLIDILVLVLLVMAVIKGYKKGFVVAIFSTIAILIGLAAALKLSAVTANHLQDSGIKISAYWLPFLSFAIVFLIAVIIVRITAKVIEGTLELAFLGWANKLAGIALYILLYLTVLSVLMFYAVEMKLISNNTIQQSITYNTIKPIAPKAIDIVSYIIPALKNIFNQLQLFFSELANKA